MEEQLYDVTYILVGDVHPRTQVLPKLSDDGDEASAFGLPGVTIMSAVPIATGSETVPPEPPDE